MVFKIEFISVVISNHNYEEFISEAIESVLNQTYQNFEIVIVDDGSTDLSATVINKYKKLNPNKIKVIFKSNGGQGSAFNIGFEKSSGEIIAFLDADDYWYPLKLERIVQAHKNSQAVQHNLSINNEKKLAMLSSNIQWKQKHLMLEYGFPGVIPTSGLSFKRELLEKVFPIPEKGLRLNADLYVRWYTTFFAEWHSIDESLGCYRVHGRNGWFTNKNMNVAEYIVSILKEKQLAPIPYSNQSVKNTMIYLLKKEARCNNKYVIYGTGELAIELAEILNTDGKLVPFFTDSNSERWGVTVKNIEVIPPSLLKNIRNQYDKILVASIYAPEILEYLIKLGFKEGDDIIVPRF